MPEKKKPENQAEMNRRYRKIACDQEALLAPIGEVWEKVISALKGVSGSDLYYRDGEHASAVGDFLTAMVLVKVITGKLPDRDFLKAFDFTLPGDNWQPVKENAEDEAVQLSEEIVNTMRECVEKYC